MSDKELEFPDGLIVKAPNPNAPSFVKASISIKVADLGVWLRGKHKAGEEWVNLDVKEAKSGKWYAAVSTYKPKDKAKGGSVVGKGVIEDDVPFASCDLVDDPTYKRLYWKAE